MKNLASHIVLFFLLLASTFGTFGINVEVADAQAARPIRLFEGATIRIIDGTIFVHETEGEDAESCGITLGTTGTGAQTTTATTLTVSSANLGTAAADRYVVVLGYGNDDAQTFDVNSVTVGGVAATINADRGGIDPVQGSRVRSSFIATANVPTGTTGNIVVSWSESNVQREIHYIVVYGLSTSTAIDSATDGGNSDSQYSATMDTADCGFAAGFFVHNDETLTTTWTGLTETVDDVNADGANRKGAAWNVTNAAESNKTITAAFSGSGVGGSMAIASFTAAPFPTLSFVGCTAQSGSGPTFTFTNHSVGTADAARTTIVGVVGDSNSGGDVIDTVTVGGVSATEIIGEGGTGDADSAIFALSNPSGTSEDIVVNWTTDIDSGMTICVWSTYDLDSLTPVDTAADDDPSNNNLVLTLDTVEHGVAVGICMADFTTGQTATWTGLTENTDVDDGAYSRSTAQLAPTSSATPLTVGCDWNGSGNTTGVTASFR